VCAVVNFHKERSLLSLLSLLFYYGYFTQRRKAAPDQYLRRGSASKNYEAKIQNLQESLG
jgi:hypothetical protein